MFDTHVHSCYSHDSKATIEDICQSAIERNISGVTITDHANLNTFHSRNLLKRFKEMIQDFESCKKKYSGQLKLYCGIEIGEFLREPNKAEILLSLTDYNEIIGSIHYLNYFDQDITFAAAAFDERVSDQQIYHLLEVYFDDLLKTAQMFDFDILAHLTYPLRYVSFKYGRNIDISCFYCKICEIYKVLIERGISLEVNTSRFRERYHYLLTPELPLLDLYLSLGGKRITLGSDAHIPENLGMGFMNVIGILKDIGFDSYYFYEQRMPKKINF